ncbi:MAG: hypothetical protein ABR563_02815 [Pyrinomonadaceae bacterium]
MRRNLLPSVLLLAASSLVFGACGVRQTPVANATGAGSNANSAPATNAAAGAYQGAGPHDTGIGGTGEDNRTPPATGNTNVEPTGVNKSAGRPTGASGNTAANANR